MNISFKKLIDIIIDEEIDKNKFINAKMGEFLWVFKS